MLKSLIPAVLFLAASLQGGGVSPSGKAFLRQLQERDSVLIADQLRYGVTLKGVTEGAALEFPDYSEGVTEGVEAVRGWSLDTLSRKGGKLDIEAGFDLTSFEEGEYLLPEIRVVCTKEGTEPDTLLFEGESLRVKTMPVDTATFQVHDLRGQIRYPLTLSEILPYILTVLGIALIAAAAVFFLRYLRRRSGLAAAPDDPPHIVALRKLDRLRGEKFWAPEKQKAFYSGITDALREYITARYGFGAMEMTTAEIFKAVKGTEFPEEFKEPLKELFETSDFVKFAKMTVDDSYNAKALPLAVNFVTTTYQSEVEKEAPSEDKQ